MEKQSFLVYLGVGFLMTLGVWGLMGGCSSSEIDSKVAKSEETISQKELAMPKKQAKQMEREEIRLNPTPVQPIESPVETVEKENVVVEKEKTVYQKKKVIEKRNVVKKVKKFKEIEEEKEVTHVVVKGDTLWGISRQYKTTVEKVMDANSLESMNVRIGQKLTFVATVKSQKEYFVNETVQERVEVIKEVPVKVVERVVEERVVSKPVEKVVEKPVVRQQPAPAKIEKVELPEQPKKEVVAQLKKEAPAQKGPTIETFTGELLTHEVEEKDSLVGIASQYETSVVFLQDINGLTEKSQLHEGQILLVPGK